MKRIIIAAIVAMCAWLVAQAQQTQYEHDLILTTSREQVWCDITELTDDEVKYHPVDMPGGITVTTRLTNVEYILFRNGLRRDYNLSTPVPAAPSQAQQAQPQAPAAQPAPPPQYQQPAYTYQQPQYRQPAPQEAEPLPQIQKSGSQYYTDWRPISKYEMENLLRNNPAAYAAYEDAIGIRTVGWTLFTCGLTLDLASAIYLGAVGDLSSSSFMLACAITGGLCEIACIPTLCVGYSKGKKAIAAYNTYAAQQSRARLELKVKAAPGGFGLALAF